MKSIILFDIDGTIADGTHRQHHLLPPKVNSENHLIERWDGKKGCYYCLRFEGEEHQSGCYGITGWRKNWDAFFAEQSKDPANHDAHLVWLLLSIGASTLQTTKVKLALITGRPEKYRAQTVEWLEWNRFCFYDQLIMRPDGDQTDDHILKLKQVEAIYGLDKILCVFEDRARIVKA